MAITPEEIAEAEAIEAEMLKAAPPAPQFNVLRDLTADEIAELAVKDKTFIIAEEFNRQKDLHADPAFVEKTAEALNTVKQRGFKLEDLPSVPEAAGAVGTALKGLAGQAWNYANIAGNVVAGAASELVGAEGLARGYGENIEKRFASNIAGTEEAMTGLSQLAEKGVKKAGRAVGIAKDFADYSPAEKVTDLFDEAGKSQVREERLTGKGSFTKAVTGAELELDPEEVSTLAAGDPFSFYLFGAGAKATGAAVKAVTKAVTPTVVSEAVGAGTRAVSGLASAALPFVGGKALTAAAVTAKGAAKAVEATAPVAVPIIGAVKGAALAGPAGAIGGLTAGRAAGKSIARGAAGTARIADHVADIGRQISGSVPIKSAYAQGARDFLQALPGATGEIAKGTILDIGLAAATAEVPQDTQGAVGFGTALGALSGAARVGGHVLSGQLIAPRAYGVDTVTPSSGQFPGLDAMHADAFKAAQPGQKARLNAVRQFGTGAGLSTDVFMGRDSASIERALTASGVPPATAKIWSEQLGVFTTDLVGRDGTRRRVVIVRDVDSAPHEALHAIQDVLGEEANQKIDAIMRDTYGDRWDAEGQTLSNRMTEDGDPRHWRDVILDETGWGLAGAKEKIYRDIYNRLEAESGLAPSPRLVEEMAKAELGRLMDEAVVRHPNADPNALGRHVWRDVFQANPEEAIRISDTYLARELAAENFDAVFKNQGPRLAEGTQLPERLARIVGGIVSALGGDPLAGRVSEIGQVPLRTPAVEAVRDAALGLRPEAVTPAAGRAPVVAAPRPTIDPSRDDTTNPIEATARILEAQTLAAEAPTTPLPGGTRSPQELLGEIAQAMATQSGVRINYLSAPGEPAAATTSNRTARRAIIEAFRTMPPEARALWEKTFFPDRVIRTQAGKYQVQGWAPEVFAANAHKLAEFLATVPDAQALVPYAIDPATRSFTPDAWQQLYQDTQNFVQNQIRGATGSGEPLVVPRSVTDAGGFAPPTRPGAVTLDQGKADFINMLFNFKLPETPRVQTGRRPLNLVGQEVSAATIPGRVEVPVRPRGEFTGVEAARQGIEGRQILEVNPLRNQLEAAAQTAGRPLPSFIEVIQKLNLESIIEVQGVPEVPQFRGNTLTLTAGFQAATAKGRATEERGFEIRHTGGPANPGVTLMKDGLPVGDISAVRKSPTEADIALINIDKEFRGQGLSEILYREIGNRLQAEGVENVTGMVVNQRALSSRSKVFPDTAIEDIVESRGDTSFLVRSPITQKSQFQAPKPKEVSAMGAEDFDATTKAFKGRYGGGLTGLAAELGASVRNAADLAELQTGLTDSQNKIATARAARDIDTMFAETGKAQFFREAIETATGKGPSEGFIQKTYDPDFQSPLKEATAQFAAPKPSEEVRNLAKEYARVAGIPYRSGERPYATAPEPLLKDVADFYEAAQHAPEDPAVQASYDALTKETADQYQQMVDAGYTIEPWREQGQPYKDSAAMVADVRDNNHLYYFPTEKGYGNAGDAASKNAMLGDSGVVVNGESIPYNDLFRAVHDFFGHAKEGYQFGPRGEFNAWGAHSEMFSPEAQGALAAETLAQNAFVNFGPHMRTESGAIRKQGDEGFLGVAERPFAEQKNVVVPQEIIDQARAQFAGKKKVEDKYELKAPSGGFSKAWILPTGEPVQLGGKWHHQWLSENPDVATKYNLDVPAFEGGDAEGVREGALKKGFVRVNHAQSSGTLTIEARAKDWRKVKSAVERLVESNLDNIDNMTVHLLDDAAVKTVDSQSAKLFEFDDAEKLQHLPFISEGEVRGQFAAKKAKKSKEEVRKIAADEIVEMAATHAEALPLQFQLDKNGAIKIGKDNKPIGVEIQYGLFDTPLARKAAEGHETKEAKRAAIVRAYADQLKLARAEAALNPAIEAGKDWYSLTRAKLTKLFGPDTKLFAQILGATSANTPVDTNFRFAIDAYNKFKAGDYDAVIAKYAEGKAMWEAGDISAARALDTKNTLGDDPTRGKFRDFWIKTHNLKPRQSNGKKFGFNSNALLRVLDGSWRAELGGPKTGQFSDNLSGADFNATIDVWAARLMRRMGNEGNPGQWRILAKNEDSVSDKDFDLAQDAFRLAGEEMGISPDSLQAIVWFLEKDIWATKGWTKEVGAKKSDFNAFLDITTRGASPTDKLTINEIRTKPGQKKVKAQLDLPLESE